jgi:predicted Zn-ribbon and HTH transcriptional regulator
MGKIKITQEGYQCERCGHKWIARKKREPRICPKCNSAWFDTPRKNKKQGETKK